MQKNPSEVNFNFYCIEKINQLMQVWHRMEIKQSDFNEHQVAKEASAHYREPFWLNANDGASVEAYGIDLHTHF